jgi:hypothetical protein
LGAERVVKAPERGAVTVLMSLEGLAGYAVAAALRADRSVRVLASDVTGGEVERAVAQRRPRVVIVDERVEYSLLLGLGRRAEMANTSHARSSVALRGDATSRGDRLARRLQRSQSDN